MAEEKVKLIDQILKDAGKVYDEKMYPLIIEDAKAKFKDAYRVGQKQKIQIEKDKWNSLLNIGDEERFFSVDSLANQALTLDAINEKLEKIEQLYEELFSEKLS